jgi:undecaprenyl-diphosphatase
VIVALLRRRPELLVPLVAADLLAEAVSGIIKPLVGRSRPPARLPFPGALVDVPHGGSFPSGHTATSFACATVLTAYTPRLAPLWIVLACAVGFSRVYVGVHYPLDVIAGAVLGTLVALGVLALWRRFGARALRMPAAARRRSRRSPRSG